MFAFVSTEDLPPRFPFSGGFPSELSLQEPCPNSVAVGGILLI